MPGLLFSGQVIPDLDRARMRVNAELFEVMGTMRAVKMRAEADRYRQRGLRGLSHQDADLA